MINLTQLYNLGLNQDIDIFSGIELPEGSPLNHDIMVNTIMEKCGLNIPIYADPNVMRSAITLWSAKNQYTFIHIGKIYAAKYSPIENTDRYDSITVNRARDMTDKTAVLNKKTEDAASTNQNTNTHGGRDTSHIDETTSADNVDDYQPKDHTHTTNDYNSTITDNGTGSLNKKTSTAATNDKIVDEDENTTTTQHLHGNIGVSTNTQLQTEEYELLSKYNPYNFIAGLFENELTLFIY